MTSSSHVYEARNGSHYRRHSPAAGPDSAGESRPESPLVRLRRLVFHLFLLPFAALTMIVVLAAMPLLNRMYRMRHHR